MANNFKESFHGFLFAGFTIGVWVLKSFRSYHLISATRRSFHQHQCLGFLATWDLISSAAWSFNPLPNQDHWADDCNPEPVWQPALLAFLWSDFKAKESVNLLLRAFLSCLKIELTCLQLFLFLGTWASRAGVVSFTDHPKVFWPSAPGVSTSLNKTCSERLYSIFSLSGVNY